MHNAIMVINAKSSLNGKLARLAVQNTQGSNSAQKRKEKKNIVKKVSAAQEIVQDQNKSAINLQNQN